MDAEVSNAVGELSALDHKGRDRAIDLLLADDGDDDSITTTKGAAKSPQPGESKSTKMKLRFADEEPLDDLEPEPLSPKRFNSVGRRRDKVGRKRPGAMSFDYLDIATLSSAGAEKPLDCGEEEPSKTSDDRKQLLKSMKGFSAGFYQHSSRAPLSIALDMWVKYAKEGDSDSRKPLALQARKVVGVKYKRTFLASDLVGWLISNEIVQTREQGVIKGSFAVQNAAIVLLSDRLDSFEDSKELVCRWSDDEPNGGKPRPSSARPSPHSKGSIIKGRTSYAVKKLQRKEKEITIVIKATGEVGIIRARKKEEAMLEICIGSNDSSPCGGTAGDGAKANRAADETAGRAINGRPRTLSQNDLNEKLLFLDREVEIAKEKKQRMADHTPVLPAAANPTDTTTDLNSPNASDGAVGKREKGSKRSEGRKEDDDGGDDTTQGEGDGEVGHAQALGSSNGVDDGDGDEDDAWGAPPGKELPVSPRIGPKTIVDGDGDEDEDEDVHDDDDGGTQSGSWIASQSAPLSNASMVSRHASKQHAGSSNHHSRDKGSRRSASRERRHRKVSKGESSSHHHHRRRHREGSRKDDRRRHHRRHHHHRHRRRHHHGSGEHNATKGPNNDDEDRLTRSERRKDKPQPHGGSSRRRRSKDGENNKYVSKRAGTSIEDRPRSSGRRSHRDDRLKRDDGSLPAIPTYDRETIRGGGLVSPTHADADVDDEYDGDGDGGQVGLYDDERHTDEDGDSSSYSSQSADSEDSTDSFFDESSEPSREPIE